MRQYIKRFIKRFDEKHPEWWKMIKFTSLSLLGGLTEMVTYYSTVFIFLRGAPEEPFVFLGIPYDSVYLFYAFVLSAASGYTVGFILNRKHTFHADANPVLSVALYVIMVALIIFISSWIGISIVQWSREHGYETWGLALGKPIGGALSGLMNYPISRFVIHRKKKVKSAETK